MLRLHYVPGSHGSHGRQARNVARRVVLVYLSSFTSSVKSRYVFSRSAKVNRDRGLTAHYNLSRLIVRLLPSCHVNYVRTSHV